MEYYQAIQSRAAQTAAVIHQVIPSLSISGVTAAELITRSETLNSLAQARDHALADYDVANNAENQGFLTISALSLSLPKSAEGDLDDTDATESDLLDLLDPAYAIKPRTTASVVVRPSSTSRPSAPCVTSCFAAPVR